VLAHAWSISTIQAIIVISCLVFEVSPSSLNKSDMSSFLVVAWSKHSDLIPIEVGCIFPKSSPSSVVGEPPPPSSSRHQRLSILSATLCNLAPSSKFLRCMTSPLPQIMTMTTHRALALAQVVMTSRRSTHTTLRFNLGHVCTVMPGGHLSTRGHRGRRCQPPSSVPPGHMLS
jgi:hypothetical protein